MPELNPTPDMIPQGHIAVEEMARNGFDISMCPFLAKLAMEDPEAAQAIMDNTINNSVEPAANKPAKTVLETENSKPAKDKLEKPAAIVETLPLKPATNEILPEAVVRAVDASAVKVAVQEKPKPETIVKPISQVEQALQYMQQLEEKQASIEEPTVKPANVTRQDAPSRSEAREDTGKPESMMPKRTEAVESRNTVQSEKPVSLTSSTWEQAVVHLQETTRPNIAEESETPEYALFEEPIHTLELPMVVEPEDGQEPNYEALFQEMVAEFGVPTPEFAEAVEPEAVWPEGLFELDGMDELIVDVQQRAEAHAQQLPEVVQEVPELAAEQEPAEETIPLPAILEAAGAANEVLAVVETQTEELYDEANGLPFAAAKQDAQGDEARLFAARPESGTNFEANETNEPDYHDPESLFTIMREFMWAPGTNDFMVNSGSVGHRLGRLLVQLITGRHDISPLYASA